MIICLAGMHRSGTSLFSSYLRHCGINMGEAMAAAGAGNKHGHFEDKTFLELHKEILRKNGRHMYRDPGLLLITDEQKQYANDLVNDNNQKLDAWGWKDPRTTLFLDFWNEIAPDTKFLFLYRDPLTVIDSLFRRKGERYLFFKPLMAADAWLLYNRKMLEFYNKHPEKCLIANINGINNCPDESLQKISKWLDYPLDKPYSDIYHPKDIASSLSTVTKMYLPLINAFRGAELKKMYEELENLSSVQSPTS